MTQEQVAELMDVSPEYYSKIELGKTKANLFRLEQISQLLKTPLEQIIAGTQTQATGYRQEEIARILEGCSGEKRAAIEQIIKIVAEL